MIDSQISHYRLVRKLGAGTYGEVYEGVHAHDEELRVAIKIVSPALAQDARFVDALKRECRQLDKLDHPNIVRFRDLVVNDTQVAMVLELLAGQDLHDRLAGGPLPVDTAVSVLEAMLEGLAYAHARGILHRDIKPGNVYWCDDGRVKLLDFGIARAADGTQATKTGHMVGTFDYMAPERFDGQHGSASSDVYAMGLIAWELLTGRVACPEGEPGRKMKWHLMHGLGGTRAVQAAVPGCPAWLAEVVATLAATEVAERPADGAAALALLREKRTGAGTTPAAAPAGRRPPPSTVMGPASVGSVPPVAASVPPVSVPPVAPSPASTAPPPMKRSAPSPTTGRSAPPGTVMSPASMGPQPSAPPAPPAPPVTPVPAPLPAASPAFAPALSPAASPSGGSKLPLLVGGVVLLAGGAWFALRGPSVGSIELDPAGDVSVVVGASAAAPAARALDAQGNVVPGVEVSCTSDTPAVRLRDGQLSATEAAQATITCAAGGAEARFAVEAAPAPGSPEAEEEAASKLMTAVQEAVKAGDYPTAKAKLAELAVEPLASTRAGKASLRMASEINLVGTDAAPIEVDKWFQGQADLSGSKATLLVFWEVWCPHCKKAMPKLAEEEGKYTEKGIQIVALTKVTKSATDEQVDEFLKENKVKFPVGKEKDGSLSKAYVISGIPAAALVKDGKVIWRGHPARLDDATIDALMSKG